ncbi:CDC7-like protein [Mya arenaria]|uniref:non-specific serine/threonine protein kinase n=1 Tax=Mya arenaria TaxID=6604 RepID=A0ABY7GC20_MYAAR|nr:CDC7-like protein [Mya arenaria]
MESVDVDRNSTPSSSKKKAKRLPRTFSSVFLAKMRHYPEIEQMFALKHIIPTSHPSRIEGELKCLQEIGGCDNVIGVELCLRNRDHVVIVMQYFPHIKFQDYLMHMSFQDVHNYMYNMLLALRRVHMFDMIHRDNNSQSSASTTPVSQTSKGTPSASPADPKADQYTPPTPNLSNSVFVKRVKSPRRLLLAKRALMLQEKDDVLSQRKSGVRPYRPAQCQSNQNAPRAGTPGFRSPEVLMKCPDQSTAVDIWSAGVIFLSLMSGRYPFFRANDDLTALAQIISTFGSEPVKEAAKACGKNLICNPAQKAVDLRTMCMKLRAAPLSKHHTKRGFKIDPATEQSWKNVPDSSFHLLSRLLDLNPYTRITAAEALEHPFFVEMAEREAEGMS